MWKATTLSRHVHSMKDLVTSTLYAILSSQGIRRVSLTYEIESDGPLQNLADSYLRYGTLRSLKVLSSLNT